VPRIDVQLRGHDAVVERRHDDRDAAVVHDPLAEQEMLLDGVSAHGGARRGRGEPVDELRSSRRRGGAQRRTLEQRSSRQRFAHTVIRAPGSLEIARRQSVTVSPTCACLRAKRTRATPSMIEYSFVARHTQR
jgi:hypothetical protein